MTIAITPSEKASNLLVGIHDSFTYINVNPYTKKYQSSLEIKIPDFGNLKLCKAIVSNNFSDNRFIRI